MAIIQDWKIRSRTGMCAHTERPFEDKERFFTALFADPESDGWVRRDYSVKAWEEVRAEFQPQPFSYWSSVFKVPPPPESSEVLEKASAETMLRRMIDENEEKTENARYILALMLERKKTLIPVSRKEEDDRIFLFYEHKETGDAFIVLDPQLKLHEVAAIQEEVAELLAAEEARGEVRPVATEGESESESEESKSTPVEEGSEDAESSEVEHSPTEESPDATEEVAPADAEETTEEIPDVEETQESPHDVPS